MATRRKPRSDSIAAQQARAQTLDSPIESPIELSEEERAVFDEIIEGRARDDWDRHLIRKAARLAKVELILEGFIDQVLTEGSSVVNSRGTETMNPAVSAMNSTAGAARSLAAQIGINVSQKGQSKAEGNAKKRAEQDKRKKLKSVGGTKSLLA